MSVRRSLAIARHEWRVLSRDPTPLVVLVVMPVVLMAFLKPTLRTILLNEGYTNASGAEQVVPGMAVMFSFFVVGFVGLVFFREHGWNTWDRLRVSRARSVEIFAGKVLPLLLVGVLQVVVLFSVGFVAFDLRVEGSIWRLALVAIPMTTAHVAFGVAIVAWARTLTQVNAFANLGAVVSAGLAGALVPFEALPAWAKSIAPITPAYWAMQGFREVVLEDAGLWDVAFRSAFLAAYTIAFTVIAVQRFASDETETSWA